MANKVTVFPRPSRTKEPRELTIFALGDQRVVLNLTDGTSELRTMADVISIEKKRKPRSRKIRTTTTTHSPDGSKFVFRSNRTAINQLFQRSAGGGGSEELVLSSEMMRAAGLQSGNLTNTDWSPDGQTILFSVQGTESGTDLWLLPLTGDKKPVKYLASPSDEMHGNFSPDGHLVAYTSNESGKFQVYVQTLPLSDRKRQVSTNGGYEPRWRGDGREIYYLSEDRKLMAVPVGAGPSFEVPKALFQTRVPAGVTANRMHYVPSRDGQRFLVNTQSGDASPSPITVVLNWAAGLKK